MAPGSLDSLSADLSPLIRGGHRPNRRGTNVPHVGSPQVQRCPPPSGRGRNRPEWPVSPVFDPGRKRAQRDPAQNRTRPKTTTAPSSGAVGFDSKWGDTVSNVWPPRRGIRGDDVLGAGYKAATPGRVALGGRVQLDGVDIIHRRSIAQLNICDICHLV